MMQLVKKYVMSKFFKRQIWLREVFPPSKFSIEKEHVDFPVLLTDGENDGNRYVDYYAACFEYTA